MDPQRDVRDSFFLKRKKEKQVAKQYSFTQQVFTESIPPPWAPET